MNNLVSPEATDPLPRATLPCLPKQCNHCGKNFSRRSSLSIHMIVVHGASCPSKILQYRYLAKLMAHRRISFVICYIAFKKNFKEHMERGVHLLAPGPDGVCGRFVREVMLLGDGICVVGQITSERVGFTPVMTVTIFQIFANI